MTKQWDQKKKTGWTNLLAHSFSASTAAASPTVISGKAGLLIAMLWAVANKLSGGTFPILDWIPAAMLPYGGK